MMRTILKPVFLCYQEHYFFPKAFAVAFQGSSKNLGQVRHDCALVALSFDLGAENLKEDTIQVWVWCWFGLWEEPDFCLQVHLFCRAWPGASLTPALLMPLPCNPLSPVIEIIVAEPCGISL